MSSKIVSSLVLCLLIDWWPGLLPRWAQSLLHTEPFSVNMVQMKPPLEQYTTRLSLSGCCIVFQRDNISFQQGINSSAHGFGHRCTQTYSAFKPLPSGLLPGVPKQNPGSSQSPAMANNIYLWGDALISCLCKISFGIATMATTKHMAGTEATDREVDKQVALQGTLEPACYQKMC